MTTIAGPARREFSRSASRHSCCAPRPPSWAAGQEAKRPIRQPTAPPVVLSQQDNGHGVRRQAAAPQHGGELDLSDPIQYRYFMRQWQLGGATPQLYPELFRSFEETRQQHIERRRSMNAAGPLNLERDLTPRSTTEQPIVPLNYLSGFGLGATARSYKVTAVTTVPGTLQIPGTVTATTVGFYDANYNQLGPATTVQQWGNGALMTNENRAPGPTVGTLVIAQGTYYYKTMENGLLVPHAGGLTLRASIGGTGQYTMANQAPIDVNGNGTIKICIVRNDSDCDYRADQLNNQFIVRFPIQDTFTIPENLQPLAKQRAEGYVSVTITQPDAGVGGGCTLPADFDFWSGVTITGAQMTWSLIRGRSAIATALGSLFPSNSNVVYDLQVQALGTDASGTTYRFGEVKTTTNPPPPPPPGSAYLLPMVVAYGCVAEGSLVTLADGTTRAIEEVRIGDRVRPAPHAAALTVVKHTDGVERGDMVRIVTASGHRLLLTETHPVLTDQGAVSAGAVRAGTILVTVDGAAKVTRVTREPFDGMVWSLELGRPDGSVADGDTTFIANGLVVGDSRMQQRVERAERERLAAAKRYIAPEWRIDAQNYAAQHRNPAKDAGAAH